MATVFNMHFKYAELSKGEYDNNGRYIHGSNLNVKTIRGTCQSATYKERIASITGSRNTGNIDIYSTEKLTPSTRGDNDGGYVNYGGNIYQIVSEKFFPHLRNISHWCYVAEMVPIAEVPDAIKEALDV